MTARVGRVGRARRAVAAAAAAAVTAGCVLTGLGAAPALAAAPTPDSATVQLAGTVTPAAPDASAVTTVTIPLAITNTGTDTLYDVAVSSLRSAPITERATLDTALEGDPVQQGTATKKGPTQRLPAPLAPGTTTTFAYTVDSSNDGICLCFLGVYALDLLVTAADEPDGGTATVARTQTYLPSLTAERAVPMTVGWLWPLLDRPHRLASGSVFADDDLAGSVAAGGRLDRALAAVEQVDAADPTTPRVSSSLLLLVDPEILDELVTMTRGYTVQAAGGASTAGTGGESARAWLTRLAAVLPRHDVRSTVPSDPDLVGLAARGITVEVGPDADTTTALTAALGLSGGVLPPHDLAWPIGTELDAAGLTALTTAGATAVVTTADTDDDGAVADLRSGASRDTTATLLADPGLSELAADAVTNGRANASALQRFVVSAAMTSVSHPDDSRYVFVVPGRDLDVSPAAAAAAVLATASLGTPTSPVAALAATDDGARPIRSDLLSDQSSTAPAPLGAALDAAVAASQAVRIVRAVAVGDPRSVVGDLPARVQRAASVSWVDDPVACARATDDLTARATSISSAVQVVARTTGSYNLASADAPLLLTVSNALPVAVHIHLDASALGTSNGFTARTVDTVVQAGSRPTIRVPTSVTRSGRFDVAVTLRSTDGVVIGVPARITVTSTAVGTVGRIVTFGAGALLVLALLVRGVRRWRARSTAGSGGTGPGDEARPDGTRPEGQPTVPATQP